MARKLRLQFEGAIYHVTLRGVERRPIFTEDRECEQFLKRIADSVENHGVRLYMFCLMTNHVHLVLATPRANLDRFMHGLETAYTVYFNLRHHRHGHLMQGRYGAELVEGDEYLLRLTRYLHLNPVFVRRIIRLPLKERIEILRRCRWSTYRSYIGVAQPLDFVEYGPVLGMMGGKRSKQRSAYRRFVEAGIAETDDEFFEILRESSLSIGSGDFRARVRQLHQEKLRKHKRPEDVLFRKMERTLDAGRIVEVVCDELGVEEAELRRHRKDSCTRPIAARMLCKHGGLTQREAAGILGLRTGAAVSVQMKWLKNVTATQKGVRHLLQRVDERLSKQAE